MTEQESEETKDALLLECIKRKMNLDLAKERLNQTAIQLEAVARAIREGVSADYDFTPRPWLKSEALARIIGDVEIAQMHFSDVYASAVKLGIPIPYSN